MKFAKELERDLVPEWRLKYLKYKLAKKKLKAITRALRIVNQTPRLRRRGANNFIPSSFDTVPQYSFVHRDRPAERDISERKSSGDLRALAVGNGQTSLQPKANGSRSSLAREIERSPEERPLNAIEDQRFPGLTRYGSIIGSPPIHERAPIRERGKTPSLLKLPGAALDPENASSQVRPLGTTPATLPKSKHVQLPQETDNAFEVRKTALLHGKSASSLPFRHRSVFSLKRVASTPGARVTESAGPSMRRLFSLSHKATTPSPSDVPLEAYRDLDIRQAEFFHFLDLELEKVESFYKQKEDEATDRLNVLREQLHIMRDRRLDELISHQAAKMKAKEKRKSAASEGLMNGFSSSGEGDTGAQPKGRIVNSSWLNPIDSALEAVRIGKYGKTTKAMTALATPSGLITQNHQDDNRDYIRRPDLPNVPYQTAKRKLKLAMQEYYRGLDLLKSYALLNRTAFRKINKKYDKNVNARPPMRYMQEKVNKAWFVQSDVIEGHIRTVEDLYARYFERGNHKVAVGKLRVKIARAGDFTENSFRNGLSLAAGLVFGVQGLVYGNELLFSNDPNITKNTSYLLQIYAGYFLMNFLFILFCLACRVWHESKINYAIIFEYNTRHHLDWRQLCELPCFYFFLLGLVMWLNFNQFGGQTMYYYYPIILIGLSALILIFPAPVLYFRSRKWLLYSMWRLLLAGLYPVEFRDFYLGDMFCSLTYSMGGIEQFFCLYANGWGNPPACNSSHSRLLGFFTTLPGIWRAFQCIRRYYDTRNVFPHLVNCGKYSATIVFYITLSIYRIQKTETHRALFITFAIINSIYCSIWDVIMDWSLGDPYAKHRFLRATLGYRKVWVYYVAMVIDPILRFNWILYAVIPFQLQNTAATSFVVGLSEVCRRGMWTLFRVENEHCTNVGRFRASRDVPLPYDTPSPSISAAESEERRGREHPQRMRADGMTRGDALTHRTPDARTDLEQARTRTRSSTRHRPTTIRATSYDATPAEQESPLARGLNRVGTILRDAHVQDFERRKKPDGKLDDDSDDEDEDGDGDESERHSKGSDDDDEDERDREDIRIVRQEVAIGRESSGEAIGPSGEAI